MAQQSSQYSIQEVQQAHQELTQAKQAFESGDTESATELCHGLLERYPDYFGALTLIASIHVQQGNFGNALPYLVRASLINPNDGEMWCNLGWTYLELDAIPNAVRALERSLSLSQNTSVAHHLLGAIWLSAGEFERALGHLESAQSLDPNNAGISIRHAICLVRLDRRDEALELLKAVYEPHLSNDHKALVYQLLAEFPDLDSDLKIIDRIEDDEDAVESSNANTAVFVPGISMYEVSRDFAEGIALDFRNQHQKAWQALSAINKRIADAIPEQRETYFRQQDELAARAENWKPDRGSSEVADSEGPAVLFILGASRSGKTTAESLVGSIDGVEKGLENSLASDIAQRISQQAGLLSEDTLTLLPSDLDIEISELFQENIEKMAGGSKLVTITHPGAMFDVARLASLIPNSRFLFVKRDHDDTAFRIFAYLYQSNANQFAYDLKDIYRYVKVHDSMADLWAAKIGDRALILSYEEMVADPGATLARIAEFCGVKAPAEPGVEIANDVGCAAPYREWLHDARDKTA